MCVCVMLRFIIRTYLIALYNHSIFVIVESRLVLVSDRSYVLLYLAADYHYLQTHRTTELTT